MRFWLSSMAVVCLCAPAVARADAFEQLRAAYAKRDAVAAARAYGPDAVVTYRYAGTPEERHAGTRAIEQSFRALFDQIDPGQPLDLNFRATARTGAAVSGVYRLRIGRSPSYGRFSVTLTPDGKFASDLSTSATLDDFEDAAGPVMLAAGDENLERDYYANLTGRYRLAKGCDLVVTRSVVRLFARHTCTGEWRGLTRVSGREWTAGDRVLSGKPVTTYRFAPFGGGLSPAVEIGRTVRAVRRAAYRTEDVAFTAPDGVRLRGTIYFPAGRPGRRPGSVMVHGSGPQDRDGYASIIAVLADQLAVNGRVVLAYDKRGSGGSGGDGDRASFDRLARDAEAGMALLRARPDVDSSKVGLAGSSQAGWIAARAVANGARPADVLLLGAAGAALTVAEQNLYNTNVRMRCAGVGATDIELALDQQRAFFAFLADPGRAADLDALTVRGRARPALTDWLFPDSRSTDRSAGAWYAVLDPAFDPLPIWRAYQGRALFLFGTYDDATPTAPAMARLAGTRVEAQRLKGAQHLGLRTTALCKGDLADLTRFAPALMPAIGRFARLAN